MKQVYSRICVGILLFAFFSISSQAQVMLSINSHTDVSCNGGNDGSAIATPTGTGPYGFAWSPTGGTNDTASSLIAGSYTCTVTDSSDMSTATATITITQPATLSASISSTMVLCNGGNTGTATITVSGGTAPYTYAWSPAGGTSSQATGLSAGTYSCLVTDAHGCTLTRSVTVIQPGALNLTLNSTNATCYNFCNGSATLTVTGGTAPFTYYWTPVNMYSNVATNLCAGNYTVVVTDANACQAWQTIMITQPPPLSVTETHVNVSCNGGCNGSATTTPSGGTPPYTYAWAPGGGTAPTASGLCAGSYTCTITDAVGCSAMTSLNITQPPMINASLVASGSCGICNGTITTTVSGGSGPYTYSWAPTGLTSSSISGVCTGTHTLTVVDGNGCSSTASVTVTNSPAATVNAGPDDSLCVGGAVQFNATATGTPPYGYSWTNPLSSLNSANVGNPVASPTMTVTYTVTVTDGSGCTASDVITAHLLTPVSLSFSSTNATCSQSDGSASVTAAGATAPYFYSWSNSATTQTITNVASGLYTCTVTTSHPGCSASGNVAINNSNGPSLSFSGITPPTCFGGNNGSVTGNGSGGTPPYTYDWQPGNITTQTITGLTAGVYTLTLTDATGCSAVQTVTITQPAAISPNITTAPALCFGSSTGAAYTNPTGGTPGYTYLWVPGGQTTQSIGGVPAMVYTVTITDASGCTATQSVTVMEPPPLTVNTGYTPCSSSLCNGGASAVVTGGVGTYNYVWNPGGQTTASISNLCAGTYSVTVGDANGCTAQGVVNVYNYSPLYVGMQMIAPYNCTTNGSARAWASGGVLPYSFLWSNGATDDTLSNVPAGLYGCTITDAVGNSTSGVVNVTTAAYSVISGTIYNDVNSNCVYDSGDTPVQSQFVTSPFGNTVTNAVGHYEIHTYTTGTNPVNVGPNPSSPYFVSTCPSSGSQQATIGTCDTVSGVDFAMGWIPGIQDLRVILVTGIARTGWSQYVGIYYYNVGTVTMSGVTVNLVMDSILSFISSIPTSPSIIQPAFLQWNIGTLNPGQNGYISVNLQVPTIANGGYIGRQLFYSAAINPNTGDYTPLDNGDDEFRVIQGAYDPNEKTVFAEGLDSLGNITPNDSILSYTIFFQNTGTDTAFNIYVEDTLSPYLDPATILPGASSHPYSFELDNGLMRFSFYNIMLPDSNVNEPASHGFVKYKVKTLPNVPVGTTIENTAYIYFDFNPAVVTNTTSNTIQANVTTLVDDPNVADPVQAFPNPFDEYVTLVLPESLNGTPCEIVLTDATGRVVLTKQAQNANSVTIRRGQLEAGIYLCEVRSGGQAVGFTKLIIK